MPIQRVLKRNAVKASHIDLSQNFAFTGTVSGAGNLIQCQTVTSDVDTTLSTGQSYQIPGNSTPTISNGYTLLQKAITPVSSTSKIIAQARLYFCEPANADTGNQATMFKDTTLISFIGNQLFVYSQFDGLNSNTYQTAIGDMQAVTTGHTAGSPVTFRCNVGSTGASTSYSVRVNNGAGGSGLSYTSFAIPSTLILWEVE